MATTTPSAPVLRVVAMKRAAELVRIHGLTEEDGKRPLQVTIHNWENILREFGEEPPVVITGYIDGEPVIDGATRSGRRPRRAAPVGPTEPEDPDGTRICAGECGEELLVRKFPTTKLGRRGPVCRACLAARRQK